jgi:hypothetical protein
VRAERTVGKCLCITLPKVNTRICAFSGLQYIHMQEYKYIRDYMGAWVLHLVAYCTDRPNICIYINLINRYSALGPVLAGTRSQSGDRYGSGTLHSGRVLRGSLQLLFCL